MPSFSKNFTTLSGMGFGYLRDPHHAQHVFGQDGIALYQNHPRFPFQYYVNININKSNPDITAFIDKFLNNSEYTQLCPLIKKVDLPAMRVQSNTLNQYNRRRINQTKIDFDPIKMVFHDVADGKTLRFWDMYYRYYFLDGTEYGINSPRNNLQTPRPYGIQVNKDILGLPTAVREVFDNVTGNKTVVPVAQNQYGKKEDAENIVSEVLDNHNFGYNLERVANVRQLIKSIDIVMVHAGRFNSVTLVNPKISEFRHDTLDYAETSRTSELTITFEYEYAYYNITNQLLDELQLEKFSGAEILELTGLSFNTRLLDFLEQTNPLLKSDNPILQKIGKNVQTEMGGVTGKFISQDVVRATTASVLNGMAKINPPPIYPTTILAPVVRSFVSGAADTISSAYADVTRIIKDGS